MKILISETTPEERAKKVESAIAFGLLDASPPSSFLVDLFQEYIDGKIEIAAIEKNSLSFILIKES